MIEVGTRLQEIYDAFFIKIPSHDFSSEQSKVYQFFKAAVGRARKTVSDNLTYTLDEDQDEESPSYDGTFKDTLDQNTIELISLWMVHEYFRTIVSKFEGIKSYVGTKDFNKLPDVKNGQYEIAKSLLDSVSEEIKEFCQSFYSYRN